MLDQVAFTTDTAVVTAAVGEAGGSHPAAVRGHHRGVLRIAVPGNEKRHHERPHASGHGGQGATGLCGGAVLSERRAALRAHDGATHCGGGADRRGGERNAAKNWSASWRSKARETSPNGAAGAVECAGRCCR